MKRALFLLLSLTGLWGIAAGQTTLTSMTIATSSNSNGKYCRGDDLRVEFGNGPNNSNNWSNESVMVGSVSCTVVSYGPVQNSNLQYIEFELDPGVTAGSGTVDISFEQGNTTYTGSVVIHVQEPPVVTYQQPTTNLGYCPYPADTLLPMVVGDSVTFSANPVGVIDAPNGALLVNPSNIGAFTIEWTLIGCPNEAGSYNHDIRPATNPYQYSIDILEDTICQNDNNSIGITWDPPQGTMQSDPQFTVNSASPFPTLQLAQAAAGTYYVYLYAISGGCWEPKVDSIYVHPLDDATFSYSKSLYCISESDPLPIVTGLPNGNFSNLTNHTVVHPYTGSIDLDSSYSASSPGNTIKYETIGRCPDSHIQTISINDFKPSFTLDSIKCANQGGDLVATNVGGPGTFSFSPNFPGNTDNTGGFQSTFILYDLDSLTDTTYTITYNLDPQLAGCSGSYSDTVHIEDFPYLPKLYDGGTFCGTLDSIPTFQALPSTGILSFSPTTLAIETNPASPNYGHIFPNQSPLGTYTVTFTRNGTFCSDTIAESITLQNSGSANLDYGGTTFCANASLDPAPFSSLATGGIFSCSTNLAIDDTSGVIDLDSTTPNVPHVISYILPPNLCADDTTLTVTILDFSTSFSYPDDTLCKSAAPLLPSLLPDSFPNTTISYGATPPNLLAINPATGEVDPAASATIQYQISLQITDSLGTCTFVSTADSSLTIGEERIASFNLSATTVCVNDPPPTVSVIDTGGKFTSTDPIACPIDPSTGVIDPGNCTPGNYKIIYRFSGSCPTSDTVNFSVRSILQSQFSYPQDSICNKSAYVVRPDTGSLPFDPGGLFTLDPASSNLSGIIVDQSSGAILSEPRIPGTYYINYAHSGICPSSYQEEVVVVQGFSPSLNYFGTTFCNLDADLPADTNSLAFQNGSFYCGSSSVEIDPQTGTINLENTPPGIYDIIYAADDSTLCPSIQTVTINVVQQDTSTSLDYPEDTCQVDGGILLPSIAGDSNGVFSFDPLPEPTTQPGGIDLEETTPGTYYITYTINVSGCQQSFYDTLIVRGRDSTQFAYEAYYCQSAPNPRPISLPPAPGIFISDSAGLLVDPNSGELFLELSQPGDYILRFESSGDCPATEERMVEIKRRPETLQFEADSVICENDEMTIFLQQSESPRTFLNGFPLGNQGAPIITYSDYQDGDTVWITQRAGDCRDTTAFTMTVHPYPYITVLDTQHYISGGQEFQVLIESSTDSTAFIWNASSQEYIRFSPKSDTAGGDLDYAIVSFGVENLEENYPGQIDIVVQPRSQECTGEPHSITVFVNPEEVDIFVPEVMTPNGDQQNDTWLIQFNEDLDPADYKMELYNRSLGLLKVRPSLYGDWNGDNLPDGVYHWVLRRQDDSVVKSGNLTIRSTGRQK